MANKKIDSIKIRLKYKKTAENHIFLNFLIPILYGNCKKFKIEAI